MTKGRVIKNYNGYYYVDVGREGLIECRRRGKLLKAKILVGDKLEITELGQDKGVIEALLPRRNQIRRRPWPISTSSWLSWRPSRRIRTSSSSIRCS